MQAGGAMQASGTCRRCGRFNAGWLANHFLKRGERKAGTVKVAIRLGPRRSATVHDSGLTNTEQAAVELTDIVPFLVEDELKARGGQYSQGSDWASYVVTDGLLMTGQNPAASAEAAAALLQRLS